MYYRYLDIVGGVITLSITLCLLQIKREGTKSRVNRPELRAPGSRYEQQILGGDSNKYPRHTFFFLWRNETNYPIIMTKYTPHLNLTICLFLH